MRIIREHCVYGRTILTSAKSETQARIVARMQAPTEHIWEVKEISPGQWEVYVARGEDAFALND